MNNSEQFDKQDETSRRKQLEKESMVSVLEEFNRYRRGEGEYMWNEDPSKNKPLSISPRMIGEAIDYAIKYIREH